jgi:hypothetical protein
MNTVAIIVINRDRPDITDRVVEQIQEMGEGLDCELFVVEAGSKKDLRSKYATHWFRDRNYKGRYYAFNRGLRFAHQKRPSYDYYWFVVNDIRFPEEQDSLRLLVDAMRSDPRMACIGPAEPEAEDYRGCHPQPGRDWHKASTIHGLAMLMRGEAYRDVGYCNPCFHYSQGASSELAYKLYKENWFLAYSDKAVLYHDQSGSTYGVVTRISRHEYHRRARKYASRFFVRKYGQDWDRLFSSVLPDDVEEDLFAWHRSVWQKELSRNWKEFCPWFWKCGSAVKKLFGMRPCKVK